MTRSSKWLRPRFAAPRWSQLLRRGAASGILCAALLVASAHTARAGIDVWTRLGPPVGVGAPVIDPITPSTLYAAAGGGVFKSTDAGATGAELDPPRVAPFDQRHGKLGRLAPRQSGADQVWEISRE